MVKIVTAMLIYRYLTISEKLSDIIALGKCEVHNTQKANIALALAKIKV